MITAEGGVFDRMRLSPGLVGVINAFRHTIANAAACAVMDKYPTPPLQILMCTDAEQEFR